jgi:uncharacterized 2Fe-2S/4Fe-4S cluster protein (DUF4445 family)
VSKYRIKFLPYNVQIDIEEGETLIRAAMEAGVHVNASCGGEGVCGKCRVILEEGTVVGGVSEKLSADDQNQGYRLACQSIVKSDLVVRIPVESTIDARMLNRRITPRQTARIQEFNFDELKQQGLIVPPVEKKFLKLPDRQPRIICRMSPD